MPVVHVIVLDGVDRKADGVGDEEVVEQGHGEDEPGEAVRDGEPIVGLLHLRLMRAERGQPMGRTEDGRKVSFTGWVWTGRARARREVMPLIRGRYARTGSRQLS